MADGFSVEFTYTEAELQQAEAAWLRHAAENAPTDSLMPYMVAAFTVSLAGAGLALAAGATTQQRGGVVAALLLVAYIAGAVATYRRMWRQSGAHADLARSRNATLRHMFQCHLRADGLMQRTSHGEVLTRWLGLEAAWIEAGLLLLVTEAGAGFTIPVRAFASPDEAAAALAYAQERIAAAKG